MKFRVGNINYIVDSDGIFDADTGIEIIGESKSIIKDLLTAEALYEYLLKVENENVG